MRRSVSGLMVLLLVGAAALLAVLLAAPTAVRAAEADTAAVTVAEGVAEDAALEAAEAELDDEEEIGAEEEADDEDESDDEADDEAEEEDASFVEVDSPAAAESTEVPQTPGVVVQPKPVDPAPAPAKQQKKAKKVRLPMEAAYYGEKLPTKPKQFSLPEYGDPNPKRTAAKAKKALKSGKPAHPRVFTANYLSPVPQSHPRVKCYGKGKKEKCFRVTRSGQVVGRHVHRGLPRVVAETRSLHAMEKKGFQTAEYDDKLAKWKPRRHKRTLSPAAVMSFAEVDAEEEAEEEAEDEAEDESEEEADEEDEEEVEDEAEAEEEDEMEDEIDEADEADEEDAIDEEADAMDEVDEEDAEAEEMM